MLQIAGVVVIIVLVVGLYRAKSDASKTEAHVRALQIEISEREASMRALRAEIAEQESPANIEHLTEQHFGSTTGSQAAALPENAMDERLPPPRPSSPRHP
jgi:hypothetical protein